MTLLSLLGMLSPCAQTPSGHDLALPIMATAPTLDGRLGDGEWAGAMSLFGFRDLASGRLCVPHPDVRLGRDSEALYLAASLPKPAGATLKRSSTVHDGPLWEDDALEFFVAPRPGAGAYYQFVANAAGAMWESAGRDAGFSCAWEARVGESDAAWFVELRLPFASLGVAPPAEGEVWSVNVGWDRQTPSQATCTWAPVKSGFHEPAAFRRVGFLERAVPLRFRGVSDPQSGVFEVRGPSATGREVQAGLRVRRRVGDEWQETAVAHRGGDGEFAFRADLRERDGLPAPGEYEARLVATAGDLALMDLTVPFTIRPVLELALRKYVLRGGKVVARISAPGLQLPEGEGALRAQLVAADGRVAREQMAPCPAPNAAAELTFETTDLPKGAYEVRATALDPQGGELGTAAAPFQLPDDPPWLGSREGLSDRVLAPWTPVQAKGRTVSVWGRTYEFAGFPLPSAVTAADTQLLAAPIRFVATVGGATQQWEPGTTSRIDRAPATASLRTEVLSESLRLSGFVRVEYDGMLRSEITVEPLTPTTVESLVLEIPLKPEHAKYLYHYPGRWGSAYNAGALPDEGFEAPFRPFVWLGDEDRGLAWFSESDEGFTPLDAPNVVSIRREGDIIVLRIRILGEPTKLDQPRRFTFGLQATPVKPMQPDVWDYRICHAGNYGIQDQTVSFSAPVVYPAEGNIDLRHGTFEAWVRPQFDPNPEVAADDPGRGVLNRSLFDVVLPGDSRIGFYWNIDDRSMRAYYKQGSDYPLLLSSASSWQKGEWHHVALTWGEESAIWLDGRKVVSRAYSGTLEKPLEGATIQLGLTACEFDIDEVRISGVPRAEFDLIQPPALDEHTLLLDRFDEDFVPDGRRATAPAKGSPGVPGIGPSFLEGRFGRALALYGAGPTHSVLDRLAQLGVRTICFHEHWTDIQDSTSTTHEQELRDLVAACHKKGIKLLLYFGYEMSDIAPEWDLYSDECLVYPRAGGYKRQPEQTAYIVCYQSAWQDELADGIARLMDEFDIDGVYLDGTANPWACANVQHGCGYTLPDGSERATYPFLATREMMRRIYTVVKSRKPDGQVNVHQSTCMTIPTLAWATSYWDGEQFGGLEPGPFALEVLPLDAFRCEFMGRNWGVPAELLCYDRPYTYHQALSFSLLHDVLVRGGLGGSLELESQLWRVMDDFGRQGAKFVPYWDVRAGFRANPPAVKVSGYSRGSQGLLLVVSNLGPSAVDARVELDRRALGLPERLTALDALAETPLPFEADTVTCSLESLDFRIIRITPE